MTSKKKKNNVVVKWAQATAHNDDDDDLKKKETQTVCFIHFSSSLISKTDTLLKSILSFR